MKLNLTRLIDMDYQYFLTVIGSSLTTVTVIILPAYYFYRNQKYKWQLKEQELEQRIATGNLERRTKTHAQDIREENDILARTDRLIALERERNDELRKIEREQNEQLRNLEREQNELNKQERITNHRGDIARVEKRLAVNEEKTNLLEIKERLCAELTIKQQGRIDGLEHSNNNLKMNIQAQNVIIEELKKEIKAK